MVAKHLGRHLTDKQRKHWVALLLDTADELKLPDNPINENAPMPK
jgi:hemoglobin